MTDSHPVDSPDPRLRTLAQEWSLLEPEDQDLVLDFVARLRGTPPDPFSDSPFRPDPDVPFMDFGE